jgi:ankyrin repeat protein
MKVCFQGHNEVAELLLAAGANTDLKNQVSQWGKENRATYNMYKARSNLLSFLYLINARRMRTRVTVVSLSVCLLPLYCLHKTFIQQNERTSQFCAELQRFSTKGFR